jgi:hypothetical protein
MLNHKIYQLVYFMSNFKIDLIFNTALTQVHHTEVKPIESLDHQCSKRLNE